MKQRVKLLALSTLAVALFVNCTNRSGSDNGTENSTLDSNSLSNTGVNNADLEDETTKMEALQATLKNVPPLSGEEVASFFPEELNGWSRTAYSGGAQAYGVKVASGNAVYDAGDKELMLHLTDGAGETGAAIVSLAAMGLAMDSEKDTDYDISKNESVHGFRASTRETKPQQAGNVVDSDINFVYKDRYLIKLEGDGFSLDELKDLVGKLDYSALK
ncbi:hypothetical protein PQ465_10390 [Sphingobacterium oryzagri]|uniref:Lipoprotein n=1 Tax=Sphingobacterium oryzagri TaxID=3025669 RepID=A0ABY7WQE8_9SPHI|nr:hypothetical protein [Sphingobacterium sp. KACC 22765]WDF70764.1 hypothetical protein PQ465_10390 [Sphingobacterium sp. KACC 22765]